MRNEIHGPRSGLGRYVLSGAVALLCGAGTAMADPAHPAAGVLKVPNARLEVATPAMMQAAARVAAPRAGVRAFKDPVSGELRDQTPEEMVAAGSATLADAPDAGTIFMPGGGELSYGDETLMSNAVVTRDARGKVRFLCLNGEAHALDAILKGKPGKAHAHDR